MSQEFHDLEVAEVIEETEDARSIVLRVPDALKPLFDYQAGQFLTFEIPWQDFTIRRCYSLSSAPGLDPALKVTVKRVEGGRMSNWVADHLKPGDTLRVSTPEGRFLLNEDAGDADLNLYGGGSGITPLMSLAKTALARTDRNVKLVYANRDASSVIFHEELRALEAQYPGRFAVHHHLDGESGFLSLEDVRSTFFGREAGEFYVCGPGPFMDLVEEALVSIDVPLAHQHFERFVSPLDPDRREAEEMAADLDAAEVPDFFVIKLDGRKHTVPYERGQTLLAAAKKAGVNPPSSCEDGFCGSCMAQHVQGDLQMRSHKALTDSEVAQGRVLLCQSVPTSAQPVLVDYDATSFKIEGSGDGRALPRLIGAAVLAFVVVAVWFLRTTG